MAEKVGGRIMHVLGVCGQLHMPVSVWWLPSADVRPAKPHRRNSRALKKELLVSPGILAKLRPGPLSARRGDERIVGHIDAEFNSQSLIFKRSPF